jgi:hypothetical protein
MKRYRATTAALAAALVGFWGSTAANAADDEPSAAGADKVWVTEYSGKPPFKRRAVSAAEFARFEETKNAARTTTLPTVGERLHVVDTRVGRPPFKRQVVDIDASNAAEFARFEEVKPAGDERRRFGPPGKGFGRR